MSKTWRSFASNNCIRFPSRNSPQAIAPYKNLKDVVWCQEEPMNQGAWYASQHHMRRVILAHGEDLYLVVMPGERRSAAPAAGYMQLHAQQQARLVEDALYG